MQFKRILSVMTAIVLIAVLFVSCSKEAVEYNPVTELSNKTDIDTDKMVQSVTYRAFEESEKYDFDLIRTDEATGNKYYLWTVDYVTDGVATHRNEYVTQTEEYTDLYEKEVPKTIQYTNPINGKVHTLPLVTTSYSNTIITERTGTVNAMIEYGWQTYIPKPQETITVQYLDEPSGITATYTLAFKNLVEENPFQWRNDVELSAKFEIYEAEYYKLENTSIYIPYSGTAAPAIKGKEADIVRALGEDPERFIIESAKWTDEVHTENGIEVRNAVFTGRRYVGKYVANYESECNLPNCPGFNCTAVYGAEIDVLDGIEEYTITATAIYRRISTTGVVIISVGLFLLIAGAVITLFILAKRRRENDDDNRKTPFFQKLFKRKS